MPKGKPWTRADEKVLMEMVKKGASLNAIASAFKLQPDAVRMKLTRLGFKSEVVVQKSEDSRTTTTALSSAAIITHEKALKMLAGALKMLKKRGLDKVELQRLRTLVDAVQIYDSVLEKFEDWVMLESRLVEMERKIRELQKNQKV